MGAPPGSRKSTGEAPDPAELAAEAHVIPPVPVDGTGGADVKMEDGGDKTVRTPFLHRNVAGRQLGYVQRTRGLCCKTEPETGREGGESRGQRHKYEGRRS
jgi:hypothetical protein